MIKKKIIALIACLLASVLASACGPSVQTVEVTRVVPQTVVVTAQLSTMTPSPNAVLSPSPFAGKFTLTETPSPTPYIVTFSPTAAVKPTTSNTAVPMLTATPSTSYMPIPDIYFFIGASLYEKADQQEPVHLKDFTDLGRVDDCLLVQDKIVFMDNKALQLYDLSNHQVTIISQFDRSLYLYSFMSVDEVGNQIIYGVVLNDLKSDMTRGTIVGFYDLAHKTTRELTQFHFSLTVSGFDADHRYLYIYPNGQSFDFGPMIEIDPQDGHIVGQIDVKDNIGNIWAALSPGKRLLATEWQSLSPDLTQIWWQLRLYDLASSPPAIRTISLPHPPSHTTMLFWSEDGQKFYFFLVKGDFGDVGDTTGSYGLWSLDAASGELSQVAKIEDYTYAGIEVGWPWVLLSYSSMNTSPMLVNLVTGQHAYITLPERAKIVRKVRN